MRMKNCCDVEIFLLCLGFLWTIKVVVRVVVDVI